MIPSSHPEPSDPHSQSAHPDRPEHSDPPDRPDRPDHPDHPDHPDLPDQSGNGASGLRELLPGILSAAGIGLEPAQMDALAGYAGLLRDWNMRMNLTAITDDEGIAVRHFLDSLTLLPWLDAETVRKGGAPLELVDVGTGAGFPGLPLRIARPGIRLTLLDSLQKRILFLDAVVSALGLKGVATVKSRAEDAGHEPRHRERYDIATARAVAPLPVLCEYLLPFVRRDGLMIAMKAQKLEEVDAAAAAIRILGGRLESVERFELPGSGLSRTIVCVRKTGATPKAYPRKAGQPERKPLA